MGMVRYGLDAVEVSSVKEAGIYVALAVEAVRKSEREKKLKLRKGDVCRSVGILGGGGPGSSGPAGVRGEFYVQWVSMLMEIPGVSEEIAKTVAETYPSLKKLLSDLGGEKGAGGASASGQVKLVSAAAGYNCAATTNKLENLEIATRSKKESRRLGPVVAGRIVGFFSGDDPDADLT